MKKLEASLIKRLMRISLQDLASVLVSVKLFVSSSLELSHYSLSLTLSHSWSLSVFLEHSSSGSRKEKQAKGKEGK